MAPVKADGKVKEKPGTVMWDYSIFSSVVSRSGDDSFNVIEVSAASFFT